ncbi:MAG TPA: hypothetical protein VFX12_08060 [Vicinamibacterales bacterium]|nr:hypothetical protein [Vicinamibacterales bacterium]
MHRFRAGLAAIGACAALVAVADAGAPPQRAAAPDRVVATAQHGALSLRNREIAVTWRVADGRLTFAGFDDLANHQPTPALDEAFVITLGDGRALAASSLTVSGAPEVRDLAPQPDAPRVADRTPGKAIAVSFTANDIPGPIVWRALLRRGGAYWRQELTIGPLDRDLSIQGVTLIDAHAPGAHVDGSVQGSPAVAGDAFLGVEHPMSDCQADGATIECSLARTVPIRAGQSFVTSAVVGIAPPGQLRRAFLRYTETERVHPYRAFLHYNSWYDLGYFTPYDEKDALAVIDAFGEELVRKRGVVLSSFLFDDGWDNQQSLWSFNSGFPHGFTPLKTEAAKYGAAPGVWMSPFGGYGKPRELRLTYGKQQGFETNARGFALSGPVYYKRFRDVCVDMIQKYGVNQFKFDGIGRATGVVAGSAFGSDFDAAIHLIRDELRAIKPDIFINLTTGTWPSPFWLQYADSIWRGGEDHSFAGVGSKRQQWITYRDAQTYENVVERAPLYPINSLMLHGIVYARFAKDLDTDPQNDFADGVHAYFGTGTQLQEMYVTPSLLSIRNWDVLAEAATWARRNADVLVDTHWIGGDPAALEVYGHAAWSPRLGIVVLRNPSDQPKTFALDVQTAFELPRDAPRTFSARSPWRTDQARPAIVLHAGTPTVVHLKPFEVLTLDAAPAGR